MGAKGSTLQGQPGQPGGGYGASSGAGTLGTSYARPAYGSATSPGGTNATSSDRFSARPSATGYGSHGDTFRDRSPLRDQHQGQAQRYDQGQSQRYGGAASSTGQMAGNGYPAAPTDSYYSAPMTARERDMQLRTKTNLPANRTSRTDLDQQSYSNMGSTINSAPSSGAYGRTDMGRGNTAAAQSYTTQLSRDTYQGAGAFRDDPKRGYQGGTIINMKEEQKRGFGMAEQMSVGRQGQDSRGRLEQERSAGQMRQSQASTMQQSGANRNTSAYGRSPPASDPYARGRQQDQFAQRQDGRANLDTRRQDSMDAKRQDMGGQDYRRGVLDMGRQNVGRGNMATGMQDYGNMGRQGMSDTDRRTNGQASMRDNERRRDQLLQQREETRRNEQRMEERRTQLREEEKRQEQRRLEAQREQARRNERMAGGRRGGARQSRASRMMDEHPIMSQMSESQKGMIRTIQDMTGLENTDEIFSALQVLSQLDPEVIQALGSVDPSVMQTVLSGNPSMFENLGSMTLNNMQGLATNILSQATSMKGPGGNRARQMQNGGRQGGGGGGGRGGRGGGRQLGRSRSNVEQQGNVGRNRQPDNRASFRNNRRR